MATPRQAPNGAPWGTKNRMRALAIVGTVLAMALLVVGLLLPAGSGKVTVLAFALALTVYWAVMIPLARRRNKI